MPLQPFPHITFLGPSWRRAARNPGRQWPLRDRTHCRQSPRQQPFCHSEPRRGARRDHPVRPGPTVMPWPILPPDGQIRVLASVANQVPAIYPAVLATDSKVNLYESVNGAVFKIASGHADNPQLLFADVTAHDSNRAGCLRCTLRRVRQRRLGICEQTAVRARFFRAMA